MRSNDRDDWDRGRKVAKQVLLLPKGPYWQLTEWQNDCTYVCVNVYLSFSFPFSILFLLFIPYLSLNRLTVCVFAHSARVQKRMCEEKEEVIIQKDDGEKGATNLLLLWLSIKTRGMMMMRERQRENGKKDGKKRWRGKESSERDQEKRREMMIKWLLLFVLWHLIPSSSDSPCDFSSYSFHLFLHQDRVKNLFLRVLCWSRL